MEQVKYFWSNIYLVFSKREKPERILLTSTSRDISATYYLNVTLTKINLKKTKSYSKILHIRLLQLLFYILSKGWGSVSICCFWKKQYQIGWVKRFYLIWKKQFLNTLRAISKCICLSIKRYGFNKDQNHNQAFILDCKFKTL